MWDRASILTGPLQVGIQAVGEPTGEIVRGNFTDESSQIIYFEGTSVKSLIPKNFLVNMTNITGQTKTVTAKEDYVIFETAEGKLRVPTAEIISDNYTLVYATATDPAYSDRQIVERHIDGYDYYFDLYRNGKPVVRNVYAMHESIPLKSNREAPKGVTGGINGLFGTTEEMEYRFSDGKEWFNCSSAATNVPPGTYYVRYKENRGYLASPETGALMVIDIKGDINGDGKINLTDIMAASNHHMGIGAPLTGAAFAAADINSDGAVNLIDIMALSNHHMGIRLIE